LDLLPLAAGKSLPLSDCVVEDDGGGGIMGRTVRLGWWGMAVLLTIAIALSTTVIALAQAQMPGEDQERSDEGEAYEPCPGMMPGYPGMYSDYFECPPDGFATPTMFLRVDSVRGDSTHGEHEGEIEIFGWNWSVHRFEDMPFHYGVLPEDAPAMSQTLDVSKRLDRASPALIQASLEGTRFQEVVLTVREPGDEGAESLRITMAEVSVVHIYTGQYPGETYYPNENLAFSFSSVRVEYTESDGETFSFDWSVR
jgi:type VI secretion system secreted protein Hcp